MVPTPPSGEARARVDALARLCCPVCTGLLVPDLPAFGAAPSGDPPVTCLDCGALYRWERGVLDLTPPGWAPPPRVRTYPAGGQQLDFYGFFGATLATRAYADSSLEDELYTLFGWLDLVPDAPIVVLGAENEALCRALASACVGSTILAFDDDLDALKRCRHSLMRAGLDQVVLVRADLFTPPLRPGAVESLLHFGLLHGMPDPATHLRGIARALPVGGRMAGVTLARSTLPQIAAQQEAMGARTGIRWVGMEELGKAMMGKGWSKLQHEQPSNWMARFVAIRSPL